MVATITWVFPAVGQGVGNGISLALLVGGDTVDAGDYVTTSLEQSGNIITGGQVFIFDSSFSLEMGLDFRGIPGLVQSHNGATNVGDLVDVVFNWNRSDDSNVATATFSDRVYDPSTGIPFQLWNRLKIDSEFIVGLDPFDPTVAKLLAAVVTAGATNLP